ncbi:MAG: hypothetical protein ACMXYK_02920 [Candidatus Woesearchaeota archaeon]
MSREIATIEALCQNIDPSDMIPSTLRQMHTQYVDPHGASTECSHEVYFVPEDSVVYTVDNPYA